MKDYELEERYYCDGCREIIEDNSQGLAIIFLDKESGKPVHGLEFVHASDRCKQLVVGDLRPLTVPIRERYHSHAGSGLFERAKNKRKSRKHEN